jgi:hypothetical protein
MRSETKIKMPFNADLVASFIAQGGRITQCQPGSAIRDDDGMSPRQIGKQTYAVRQDKQNDTTRHN